MALVLLAWTALAAPLAAQDDADAELRAKAKASFQQGVAAYDSGRYPEALEAFQEAYRLKPHPMVRVNIANAYDKLGKPLLAIFHFERFLEEGAGSPEQRTEVQHALRALRAQISELSLRIVPDGARVTIDDGEVRRAPLLEPVRLEKGTHTVDVELEGFVPVHRDLLLEGGQRMSVDIALARDVPRPVIAPLPEVTEPVAEPTPTTPSAVEPSVVVEEPAREEPTAQRSRPSVPPAAWITGGVSAALLIGALVTGQLALSAESDFEDYRQTALDYTSTSPLDRRAAYSDALDAADRADALALTSDVLLVSALVGVVATVYIVATDDGDDDDDASARLRPVLAHGKPALRLSF